MLKFVRGLVGRLKRHKKWVIFIVATIIASIILLPLIFKQYDDYKISKLPVKELSATNKQVADALLSSPPSQQATVVEKSDYYARLTKSYADGGDYKQAVDTFKKREQVAGSTLRYNDYFYAIGYYIRIKDKAGAEAAINKAEQLVGLESTDGNPDAQTEARELLTGLRQELTKL